MASLFTCTKIFSSSKMTLSGVVFIGLLDHSVLLPKLQFHPCHFPVLPTPGKFISFLIQLDGCTTKNTADLGNSVDSIGTSQCQDKWPPRARTFPPKFPPWINMRASHLLIQSWDANLWTHSLSNTGTSFVLWMETTIQDDTFPFTSKQVAILRTVSLQKEFSYKLQISPAIWWVIFWPLAL